MTNLTKRTQKRRFSYLWRAGRVRSILPKCLWMRLNTNLQARTQKNYKHGHAMFVVHRMLHQEVVQDLLTAFFGNTIKKKCVPCTLLRQFNKETRQQSGEPYRLKTLLQILSNLQGFGFRKMLMHLALGVIITFLHLIIYCILDTNAQHVYTLDCIVW